MSVRPGRIALHRRTRLRIRVTVDIAGVVLPVPDASVWVGNGRHLRTGNDGRVSVTLAFGRRGPRRVIARALEYHAGQAVLRVIGAGAQPS